VSNYKFALSKFIRLVSAANQVGLYNHNGKETLCLLLIFVLHVRTNGINVRVRNYPLWIIIVQNAESIIKNFVRWLMVQLGNQTGTDGSFCSNYCLERYKNKTIETAILDTSVLIDYVIVDGDDSQSLSEKVNQYLKQGWRLQGGVSVIEVTAPIGRTYHLYSHRRWLNMPFDAKKYYNRVLYNLSDSSKRSLQRLQVELEEILQSGFAKTADFVMRDCWFEALRIYRKSNKDDNDGDRASSQQTQERVRSKRTIEPLVKKSNRGRPRKRKTK
jgi:hypothetical protein